MQEKFKLWYVEKVDRILFRLVKETRRVKVNYRVRSEECTQMVQENDLNVINLESPWTPIYLP